MRWVLVLAAVLIPTLCAAVSDDPLRSDKSVIERIRAAESPGGFVEVVIEGSGPLPFTSVEEEDPPRLILYFSDTRLGGMAPEPAASVGLLQSVKAAQSDRDRSTTRVEFRLASCGRSEIRRVSGGVAVRFRKGGADDDAPGEDGESGMLPLKAVEAEPIPDGGVIRISTGASVERFRSFTLAHPAKIVFDLTGVRMADPAERRLLVEADWASSVRYFPTHEGVRLVVATDPRYLADYTAEPSPGGLRIELRRRADGFGSAQRPPSTQDLPAWIRRIDFITEQSGRFRATVETTHAVRYDLRRISSNRFSVRFFAARIPDRLAGVCYQDAAVRVSPVQVQPAEDTLEIPMELYQKVPYWVEQSENRVTVHIDALASADAPGGGPGGGEESQIRDFLQRWRRAWEMTAGADGTMDAYLACYAEDFTGEGMGRQEWGMDKKEKNSRRERMEGRITELRLQAAGENTWRAAFYLRYRASNYNEELEKDLLLRRGRDGWEILSEDSRLATDAPEIPKEASAR